MCVHRATVAGRYAYNIKVYAGEYFFPLSPCDEGSFEHGHARICVYTPRSYVGSGDRI